MDFVRVYDYLTQARGKLFDWVRPLSQEQYTQEFPFAHRTLQATMIEMASAEWLYARRLRDPGTAPGPREQWPISAQRQPTFPELEAAWAEQMPQTRRTLAEITDWETPVEYRVPQPAKTIIITASRGDIASQLCFHEVHHRAQAMAMLRQLGVAAQNLDYSLFMYRRREEPA
ncbi:MAG: DinB family protein [Armatimonadetes bacterium]|nr:DinB family protein [Armatimonadota bacterium]